jgi:toluene monooxygenase system protein E
LKNWYREHQTNSPLQCDWEKFRDPRETTYTRYTKLQSKKETFVDGIFESIECSLYDKELPEYWVSILEGIVAPMRYPWHGFQMIAAYIGQMAPNGKIAVAAMFQAADEMRRIQRIAYRIGQLRLTRPEFGENGRSLWQQDPRWQPLREVTEKLLVTYDWAEAFVGLNLVLKPLLDDFILGNIGKISQAHCDSALSGIFFSLQEDAHWHKQWSAALTRLVLQENPRNKEVIEEWIHKWEPHAKKSVEALQLAVEQYSDKQDLAKNDFLASLGF